MSDERKPSDVSGNGPPLTRGEAAQFAEQVAELTAGEVPLAEGLRAAAEETTSRRLRLTFQRVAVRLEKGESLAAVLADDSLELPPHVAGLVRAGLRSGQLSQVLTELVERQRTVRELRRGIFLATAYPLFLIICIAVVYSFAFAVLMPQFKQIFEEFETELPPLTLMFFRLSDCLQAAVQWPAFLCKAMLTPTGIIVCAVVVVGLVSTCMTFKARPGFERLRARWHWLISTVPIIGSLRTGIFVSDFARLLRVLLQQQIPLPEALQLTAAGLADANLAEVSRRLAKGTAGGQPLSDLLAATPRMPAVLVPLVRWGEQAGRLPEALAGIAEMFEGRVRLGTALLVHIFPPMAFILVGASVLGLMVALSLPLVSLIQNLS